MSTDPVKLLQAQLDIKQRKLDLIAALDDIRDQAADPSHMLATMADTLADRFDAAFSLIALNERESGQLALKAINDRAGLLGAITPAKIRALTERAVALDSVVMWDDPEELDDLPGSLQIAAVPVILGKDQRLGALLIGRMGTPFSQDDIGLLNLVESQVDSAIIQGYAYLDLQQRNRELEVIYNVDRIRDKNLPFNQMLNGVLQELRSAIPAEIGFIMLYNREGGRLELRAVTRNDLFRVASFAERIQAIAAESVEKGELTASVEAGAELRSVLCIPLILRDEILGVFGLVNGYAPGGFSDGDKRLLTAIASQMDTAIFESLEQRRMRRLLGRSVGPNVMERLMRNSDAEFLKGERAVISVLYADLRGSTNLARRIEPEVLVSFMNDYLGQMARIVLRHEATLDKFIGDEVMALFGAPFQMTEHALKAVQVGLEMIREHRQIMDRWSKQGVTTAPVGIGIATGELIHGEFGSEMRTEYSVIGHAANLGARICSAAQSGQVLIDEETYRLCGDRITARAIEHMHFKGIEEEVTVYEVLALNE